MYALTFSAFGSSDVLEYKKVNDPILKPDEIMVKMKSIGLNFADIYRRKGHYHLKGVAPYIAGYEGAGTVIDSNNNPEYKIGDRVAFADAPFANAELVAVSISHVIPLPPDISFETAAALLLQGLTAHYLATDSHKIQNEETVLIHASAGGVGQLLTQICKLLGAEVIGLTSAESKKEVSLSIGADRAYLYSEDWKAKVLEYCPDGVDVVYDSVGSTLNESFEVTKKCGQVVFYGMSGGNPEFINPAMLMDNSQTMTGGDLWNYLTSKEERIKRSNQLFEWVRSKKIIIAEPTKFKLSEGKLAHDFLESRKSTGKIILLP